MTGTQAINQLRLYRQRNERFGLLFLTIEGELRRYDNCSLRAAPPKHRCNDDFLYFTDMDSNRPLQCRKRLVRQIKLENQWYQVKWFL